ncbi:MAG: hypothetical protein Q8M29_06155 [Bacteroidota bacterium]|nr:hypothetical protein [Bacteroidota bacterium]
MKYRFLVALLSLLIISSALAQNTVVDKGSYKSNFIEGSLLLEENNRLTALENFKYAYKYDSTNANINYLIGFCYLTHPNKKHEAEKFLEKAILNTSTKYAPFEPGEKKSPVISYLYLAQAYHLDYKFTDAERMLSTYESFLKSKDKKGKEDVAYLKERIRYAKMYKAAPLEVKIKNMGDSINDAMPDFAPVISADERVMIFTHRGTNNVGGEIAPDGFAFEDVMITYRKDNGDWTTPKSISPYINTSGNDGSVGLTPDGQTLLIYKDDNGDGNLYYSQYDGKEWGIPMKFGSNINTTYWEPSACLSNNGNTLYFVSDRPGGLGGRDIYRCVKLPNGQWSLATNLGPTVNTPYDEESPFLSADGITFYFSSKGHHSMGGFDIMYSIIGEDGQFSNPMNMEFPINSTDDDLYLVASPDNRRLYYASSHEDANAQGEKDIYQITYDAGKANPLALFKGQIKPGPCDSLPQDLSVLVTNKTNGEVVGTYRPQHITGTFAVILAPGSVYTFSYQQNGEEIFNEDVDVSTDIAYDEIQKDLKLKPHNLCQGILMDYDSTKVNDLILRLAILDNYKDKKGSSKTAFKILTKDGVYYEGITEEDGTYKDILLEKNHDYDIVLANSPKIKSHFTTKGVTGGNLDKVLYLDGKEAPKESNIVLNVLVLNSKKNKKPVANAGVSLVGTNGSKYSGATDNKGKLTDIHLDPETNYELTAESDGIVSAKSLVSTTGVKKNKTFNQTIYLEKSGDNTQIPDNSEVAGTNFKFYFKYNMNEVDEQAPEYIEFITNLVKMKEKSGKVKLKILSSASNVPTKTFDSNISLSEKRAKSTSDKIVNSLKAKGISASDIDVTIEKTIVSGPAYSGDASNTEKYGKYQYVKVQAF